MIINTHWWGIALTAENSEELEALKLIKATPKENVYAYDSGEIYWCDAEVNTLIIDR